jgi:hypothetical protein
LVDYLLGKADLDEVIQSDKATSLDYVASGSPPGSPADLLSSRAMATALAELARRLYPFVDQTVFSIRWRCTRRNAA